MTDKDPTSDEGSPPLAATFSISPLMPGEVAFFSEDRREVVRIKSDGSVEVAEGVEMDEVSRSFWQGIEYFMETPQSQVIHLRDALSKYGGHRITCRFLTAATNPPCSCGWEQVKARLGL